MVDAHSTGDFGIGAHLRDEVVVVAITEHYQDTDAGIRALYDSLLELAIIFKKIYIHTQIDTRTHMHRSVLNVNARNDNGSKMICMVRYRYR